MSHHPYAYGHHNPLYRAGTVGDVPTSAQTVTVAQCQSAYYHGALAATQGITVDQGLNTLAELFPPGVIDPDQCIAGTCSLEELKACYRRGYDETKNPPAFYATDKGQTGLLWGGILGLLAGVAGTYVYYTYVAPGFVENPRRVMNRRHLTHGDRVYQMDASESEAWGAYKGDGVEAEDLGDFRRALISELRDVAAKNGRDIEVFADGEPLGAEDWICTVVEA